MCDFERITGFPNNNSVRKYTQKEYLILLDAFGSKLTYHIGDLKDLVKFRMEWEKVHWEPENERDEYSYFMAIYFEIENDIPVKIINRFNIGEGMTDELVHYLTSTSYGNVPRIK